VYILAMSVIATTAISCIARQLNAALGVPFGLLNDAGKGGSKAPGRKKLHSTRHRLSTGCAPKAARNAGNAEADVLICALERSSTRPCIWRKESGFAPLGR
jgi:hypothetical protein